LRHCAYFSTLEEIVLNELRRHADMAQAVILNLNQNLRHLVEMVEEQSFYQVSNRLARLIHVVDRTRLQQWAQDPAR
jgi:hypothetical protein